MPCLHRHPSAVKDDACFTWRQGGQTSTWIWRPRIPVRFASRPRMEFRAPMLCSRWNIVRYPIIKIITLPLCNSIRSAYLEMNLVCFFFFFYYYWTNRRGWKLWEASLVKFWFGILFFFFFFRWRVIQINFSCCLSKWGEEKLLRKLGRKFWLTLEKCERSRSVYQRSSH